MFQSHPLIYTLLMAAALMMNACAHRSTHGHTEVTPIAVTSPTPTTTTHYTVLEFQVGKTHLSTHEQEKIKTLTRVAEQSGQAVSEVRILAWADDSEVQEPKLADQRATQVRSLIKADLKSSAPVSVYNMSQDPQKFTELIREEDPKRKITFKNTEPVSFGKGPKSSLAGNKSSKAIVMIRYE
ncbi:hypothetical protein AZI86_13000 [Bdellovibrio bacteriovorus]|uniref:OmpA-like domain-containing protein n=1 Tax=Bdellovibrio bacteriovorus TaxID=959 RepID=A0A150WJ47_BDEBC|nr:hypothetical protein [Bdellovibrio bacteriovorus]KYG63736.1 hypothetical protein AZI86_13000 [Bdellovibrio bacteriovorus]